MAIIGNMAVMPSVTSDTVRIGWPGRKNRNVVANATSIAYVGMRSGNVSPEMMRDISVIVFSIYKWVLGICVQLRVGAIAPGHIFFRSLATGNPSLSRYLATVRRAMS